MKISLSHIFCSLVDFYLSLSSYLLMCWRYAFIAVLVAGCQNQSTDYLLAGSYIKAPLKISPEDVSVPVSKTVQFSATGGTPPYTFSVFSGSGTLSGSVYTAPSTIGSAVVSVKDAAGTRLAALITIVTDANCPTNYIPVSKNTAVGTTVDFCVSKYEMKCSNANGIGCSGAPIAMAANQPWISITQGNAKTSCASLGTQYHLITNAEWMTIARSIEATASNWSSGTVSSGALNRGHSDSSPANTLAAATDDNPCSGTGDTCSATVFHDQRRTHTLANGETIWDFAGNTKEFIDWYLATGHATSNPGSYTELNAETPTASMPATTFKSNDTALTSTNGLGKYWTVTNGAEGYAARGGFYTNGTSGGIYQLDFGYTSSSIDTKIGFRCAYQ